MWQDILIVDRGSKDGIEPNMAVLSQKGLIGRVIEVSAATSKVELLTSKIKIQIIFLFRSIHQTATHMVF